MICEFNVHIEHMYYTFKNQYLKEEESLVVSYKNLSGRCVNSLGFRICIPLISWMKSGRSFVIWPAPVWISSLLGVTELAEWLNSMTRTSKWKCKMFSRRQNWIFIWYNTILLEFLTPGKKQQKHKNKQVDFLETPENLNKHPAPCLIKESMVLILSTSAIIGAKTSAVPHFLTGLPFWIVASGNIGTLDEKL